MTGYESKKAAAQGKLQDAFNDWWDNDYDDSANPYSKDSFAYWAWAGWQAALAQPAQEPEIECDPQDLCAGCRCHLSHLAQEPDWKALVLEHNADCDSRCDMDACGYKEHFEFSNRRCPTCPVKQKIDVNYATQPAQEPVAWMFQHEETGRTMCVDAQQLEWGFEKGNPRLKKIAPLYTTPPQPAQEPVAYLCKPDQHGLFDIPTPDKACTDCFPVYAAPPQRTWAGLTDEETSGFTQHEMAVVKYVSKVLQEKNT